jgi:rubrerythrin
MTIPTRYEDLSSYLGDHIEAEEHSLRSYEELVEGRGDDAVSYLVRLILADEERHHEIFTDIQATLEGRMHWRNPESHLPSLHLAGDVDALLATTVELLRLEKADFRELRRLRRAWRRKPGERGMWALLVGTAELDTKKHIRILRYVRSILRDARRQ